MTTSSPKYSFVLPADKGEFLTELIDSILAQSYKDFALIIVDDASPDDIKGVVDSYDDWCSLFVSTSRIVGESGINFEYKGSGLLML